MRNPRRHKYYITMNNYLDLSGVSEKITSGVRKKHRLSMLGLKPPLEDSSGSRSGLCAVGTVMAVWTQDVRTRHSSYKQFHFLKEDLDFMKKKSFLMYVDQLEVLDCMDDVQAGKLLRAAYAYHKGDQEELDKCLQDPVVKVAFVNMRNAFEANAKKYEEVCKRKQEAGRKGGLQRAENQRKEKKANTRKVANSSKSKQIVANQADTVTDIVTDTVTDTVSTTVDINKERYSEEYPKKAELSLPSSSDSSVTKSEFECLNEWMPQNTPFVLKLAMQMTEDEYLRLRRTYSKAQIADGLQALNNWKQLPKRRTSVYQSLSDELTRRYGQQK